VYSDIELSGTPLGLVNNTQRFVGSLIFYLTLSTLGACKSLVHGSTLGLISNFKLHSLWVRLKKSISDLSGLILSGRLSIDSVSLEEML